MIIEREADSGQNIEAMSLGQVSILGIHDEASRLRGAIYSNDRDNGEKDLLIMEGWINEGNGEEKNPDVRIVSDFLKGRSDDENVALEAADAIEREVLEKKLPEIMPKRSE